MWEADLDGEEVRWSDGLYAIFGLVPAAAPMTRGRIVEMVLPEDRALYAAAVDRLHEQGEADVEMRVRRPGGALRWVYGRGRLLEADKRYALGIAYDITARKEAEIALRESETRLQLALAAGGMGVWDWDLERDIVHWSEGMFTLLGLPGSEVPSSKRFFAMVLEADRAALSAAVGSALVTGNFAHEFRLRRADGAVIWLAAQGAAVRDANGRIIGLMGANFEITERKQADVARDEASRRKDDFLAMLAHELRNPLAAIGAAADLLPQTGVDARAAAAAGIIARQVGHLARLVDDLVDVARITRGRVTLKCTPTDLAPALLRAIEQVDPVIVARAQSIALSLPDEPVRVLADPTRLVQVFVNLLANAAKYSDAEARIDVVAMPSPEWVEVVVQDTGAGIDPAMLPHVFEPFAQGPRALDRAEGGLGIGLSVVKALVELHGGTVCAHSDGAGRGSRFTVRLPRASAGAETVPAAPAPARSSPLRILVVDDNADAAESLAMLLELEGHVVKTAMNGESALALAASFAPDVALLDIGLPGMDGYALAAALRADPVHRALRLVALTGYGQPEDRERSRAAGFDMHLVKPVAPEELTRCLRPAAPPVAHER
jgi:PAS domain S-box-containing protein